jgi:hypothetical protein
MMKSRAVPSLAILYLFAVSSVQASDSASNASQNLPADPKSAIVCHHEPPPTGTRLGGSKVCKTQKQWDDIEAHTRDAIDDASRRALESPLFSPTASQGMTGH